MNKAIAVLALSLVSFASSFAGGFGGPPPFTNGSPLPTGVDGSYLGAVSGSNMSGVIAFQYSSGVQTAPLARNAWVIFYEGQVYRGFTDAAISDGRISGILGTSTSAAPFTSTSSSVSSNPPFSSTQSVVIASNVNPSGYFNAKLNNNSPTGSFKGSGMLAGKFTRTIINNVTGSTSTTVATETISAPFKVNGVRSRTGP